MLLHTGLHTAQGESLEHCTASDILSCDTLKRQENEFSSYLCKQFRKHIHPFLISERFYFCGDFPRTKVSIPKLHPGKEKAKQIKPHNTVLAISSVAPIATINNILVSLAHARAQVTHVTMTAFTVWSPSTMLLMDAALPMPRGILPQAPRGAASRR